MDIKRAYQRLKLFLGKAGRSQERRLKILQYAMEGNMRAEEIARRLGISRSIVSKDISYLGELIHVCAVQEYFSPPRATSEVQD